MDDEEGVWLSESIGSKYTTSFWLKIGRVPFPFPKESRYFHIPNFS